MSSLSRKALRRAVLLLTAFTLTLAVSAVQAKSVTRQNFAQLLEHTDSIVIGAVTGRTDGFQQGLPYTEITLEVAQSVKGNHGTSFTFRQFGLIAPKRTANGRVNLMVTPAGWPTFIEGEQVMLFLHEPASETGFQTTAGLTQGKFSIRGNRIANGLLNESLFEGVNITAPLTTEMEDLVNQPGGAYQAEAFFQLVRRAVDENWLANGGMTHEK